MLNAKLGTNHLVTKGKKAVYHLCRAYKNCKEMSQNAFSKIFDSIVQSILLYSSEIWGLQRLDSIEKVHLLACKRYLGVPIKTPNKIIYGELGRYYLFANSNIRCVKYYWFRVLQMEQNRLPKQAYQMLLLMDETGKKCWATGVIELLCRIGFYFVWLNQGVGNITHFLAIFKQRLIDIFIREWIPNIRDKERYEMRTLCKYEFGIEKYLLGIDTFCFGVALTQIRIGVLPINSSMYTETVIIQETEGVSVVRV